MRHFAHIVAFAVLGAAMAPGVVVAQSTATAGVLVAQGLALSETVSLDFGDVAAGGGGTVTVQPTGALTTVSAVAGNPLVHLGGTVSAGRFRVFDIARKGIRRFSFTVVDASITLSNAGGAGADYEMIADMFTHDAPTGPPWARTTPTNGYQVFVNVGARLNVKPTQAAGNYVGTYSVRIDEQ